MKNFKIPYGVCEIQNGGTLRNIQEKPEYDFLVSTGMYVLEPSVFQDIPRGQVYHMTDVINDYLKRGENVGVYPVSDKAWLDMGQFEALQEPQGVLVADISQTPEEIVGEIRLTILD